MQRDKIIHFLASAAITVFVMLLFLVIGSNLLFGALAGVISSISAGLAKETADWLSPCNSWDWKDILADGLGTIAGLLIGILLFIL